MEVQLRQVAGLRPGAVSLPGMGAGTDPLVLHLGARSVTAAPAPGAPPGEAWLAPDVWAGLAVPLEGIRLQMRPTGARRWELGPAVAVLYAGVPDDMNKAEAGRRLAFYFGHRPGQPGLIALGFAGAIDWETATMTGYVLDSGSRRAVLARFPVPAVVRLTWSIPRDVISRLRELTGDRTFNWVRNIGKWQFCELMQRRPEVAPHLPDTRLLRGPGDLAAMLARYGMVFVKDVFSIKGKGVVRVRRTEAGLEVRHMNGHQQAETVLTGTGEVLQHVRRVLGEERCIVQQGLDLTGREGRALDFRICLVRDGLTGWRTGLTMAKVAPDDRLVITNAANGAVEEEPLATLQRHHGMDPDQSRRCLAAMVDLCQAAVRGLEGPCHPLGIVGFDVAVEAGSHRLWLLEANSVPGWKYEAPLDQALARSQADYALRLTGFEDAQDRQP